MRRRDFIAASGAALTLPAAAAGQSTAPPVIGFLRSTDAAGSGDFVRAFREGLAESGFVEGRDIIIEYRWAENRSERLPTIAAELVDRRVAAIVVNAGAAPAAKAATSTVPIVFVSGEDPVRLGLVASLARPTGNLTGVAFVDTDLVAKRFGMLHEMTPRLATIAVLHDPTSPGADLELKLLDDTAKATGRRILVAKATAGAEIDAAYETFARASAQSVYVGIGSVYNSRRDLLIALAARHRLPASYPNRVYVDADGLLSYGPNLPDAYRRAGVYVARILKGAKPADLPVEQPTKYELVINQRAAKAIGFEVPAFLLVAADEVIE